MKIRIRITLYLHYDHHYAKMIKRVLTMTVAMLASFLSSVHVFCLDGERQTEGSDTSRKRDTRSSTSHHKSEDTSDSREDEAAVSLTCMRLLVVFSFHCQLG